MVVCFCINTAITDICFSFNFFSGSTSTLQYIVDNLLLDYTLNTIYLVTITSFFSLLLGIIPAWIISNYNFFGRRFFDIVLYLPLAIPSYIMGFTYIDILSYTGPLQSFLREHLPLLANFFNKDYLQIEVLGVLLGLALYPYIYILHHEFLLALQDQIILMFLKTWVD